MKVNGIPLFIEHNLLSLTQILHQKESPNESSNSITSKN